MTLGTLVVSKETDPDTKEKRSNQQRNSQGLGSDPPLTPGGHSNRLWPRPHDLQSDRLGILGVGWALERI